MLKYSLIAASVMALLIPTAQAQVGGMSMDEQIARIHQAELEIQALDAAKEQERQAAQKKAADIQRKSRSSPSKKLRQLHKKPRLIVKRNCKPMMIKLGRWSLESKRLDIELKKAQLELQKKMIEAKANRADEFVQADLDAARAKVQTLKEQSEALQTSVQ